MTKAEYKSIQREARIKANAVEEMVNWMVRANCWGADFGYHCIQGEHPEWFDEETDEPLEEYENYVYFELDWEPYIREEAEAMYDEGYRLVPTGENAVAGYFIDWVAEYKLELVA